MRGWRRTPHGVAAPVLLGLLAGHGIILYYAPSRVMPAAAVVMAAVLVAGIRHALKDRPRAPRSPRG